MHFNEKPDFNKNLMISWLSSIDQLLKILSESPILLEIFYILSLFLKQIYEYTSYLIALVFNFVNQNH